MDAFAASIACGAVQRPIKWSQALRLGIAFGVFQTAMTALGWLIGSGAAVAFVARADHWIAFVVLTALGLKMIHGAFTGDKSSSKLNFMDIRVLLGLAVATSLDALAVGVSIGLLKVTIVLAALVIGAVAFALSVAGAWIGDRGGRLLGKWSEVAGGAILALIGARILVEHLAASSI